MRLLLIPLILFGLSGIWFSCETFEPAAPAGDALLDGPVEGLSEAENLQFLRGDIAFNDDVFTAETWLGTIVRG